MSATITLLFGLLVAIVVLVTLATRLRLPYAILLVLAGLALGFIPGLPTITLNPEFVLVLFLPPLIYSSAWLTSWREFRASLRPILQLALGLVLVTTLVIAAFAHFVAGLSWPVAFVLGAVVSPTDAVAASATARQLGLPRRIVTGIEGESMANDATGLVVYRFAVAAVVTGSFSLWQAGLQFVTVSLGGLLVGLVIAWPVAWLHRHLDDAPIEITITLLTPYAAYLLADALQISGILAVLSAGLYLSRQSSRFFSSNAVWNVLVFLLNGLLFLLIGLQLRTIVETIAGPSLPTLLWQALLISLAVIAVRLAWVFPAASLPRLLLPRLRARDPYPGMAPGSDGSLGRYARRDLAGRGAGASPDALCRCAIPATQPGHLLHLRGYSGDLSRARAEPGTHHPAARPPAGRHAGTRTREGTPGGGACGPLPPG
jgi:monovalent cation/hydrogen antiporter